MTNQTNPHPEQLSACCNAPVVLCEGNAWDVPLSTMRAGSTYFYGCTKCHEACDLSSTDSPETYSTGDVNQGASKFETPPALAPVEPEGAKQVRQDINEQAGKRVLSWRKQTDTAPVEPDELYKILFGAKQNPLYPEDEDVAEIIDALIAWRQKAVDAAVAAELQNVLHDTGGQSDARWTFENVKRRLEQQRAALESVTTDEGDV